MNPPRNRGVSPPVHRQPRKSPRLQARAELSEGQRKPRDLAQLVNLRDALLDILQNPDVGDAVKLRCTRQALRTRAHLLARLGADALDPRTAIILRPSLARNNRIGLALGLALLRSERDATP